MGGDAWLGNHTAALYPDPGGGKGRRIVVPVSIAALAPLSLAAITHTTKPT
jgi:hypothetical protein